MMKKDLIREYALLILVLGALVFSGISIPVLSQDYDNPWRTELGRRCIESWMQHCISQLNSTDLGSVDNARKPWRFNDYGLLLGKDSWTNNKPDVFDNYENLYHWVWVSWNRDPNTGYWPSRLNMLNLAGVRSCKEFTKDCVERGGGGTGGGTLNPSSKGAVQTPIDYVEQSENLARDGVADWAFPIRLIGSGTVIGISINNTNGVRSIWDTYPGNGMWLTAVVVSGRLMNNSDGSVRFDVNGTTDLDLYVAENGSLSDGNTNYIITVTFLDGRTVTIKPANNTTGTIPMGGGSAISGYQPPYQTTNADIVGPNKSLQGDGDKDWVFPITLSGIQQTITGITIQNTDGIYSLWDTIPGSVSWLIGVTDRNGRILNSRDGSVSFNISGPTDLYLYVCDNGSLGSENTNYRVIITLKDGSTIERDVPRR